MWIAFRLGCIWSSCQIVSNRMSIVDTLSCARWKNRGGPEESSKEGKMKCSMLRGFCSQSARLWRFLNVGNTVSWSWFHLNSWKISILGEASCLAKNRLFYIHLNGRNTVLPTFKKRHCFLYNPAQNSAKSPSRLSTWLRLWARIPWVHFTRRWEQQLTMNGRAATT